MKYDFAHPCFKNGQLVFDKKEKPLFDILREKLLRLRVVVRPDASIYLNGHCYARIRNYGHSLEIIRQNDGRREYLRGESDINRFVGELADMRESIKRRTRTHVRTNADNTDTEIGSNIMNINEAKQILKNNGYRLTEETKPGAGYGDGATIFTPTGADGQWPSPLWDPMCTAIMKNDVQRLREYMNDGFQIGDYYEDGENDEDGISFDDEYHREFEEDYSLVFRGGNINDALLFMLDYNDNFYLAPFDLMNLFHAGRRGCQPEVLRTMIWNYIETADCGDNEAFDGMTWKEVLDKVDEIILGV